MNQVRLRARRRTLGRATVLAGVVTVSLVSAGIAVAQNRQGPVTPPAATSSPASPMPSAPPVSTPPSAPPALPEQLSDRSRAFQSGDPRDETLPLQRSYLYVDGEAAKYLQDVRKRVAACSPKDRSISITAEGFAGDDALLIVTKSAECAVGKRVMLRKGDVLTEIYRGSAPSDSAMRELARKAAARF
ncbi:hypothetical protein [Couchioplanes azureus]|uniref:hypothetical protein n=1 Tax=Couchioplanes caeruleus TaxID=56438 RepID=UPI001670E0A9|nr:hypothetical protein [Couchioplanes caeruleus]GGQ71189.1 hypothetical protein GCM10010166_46640 [Couchioplanes caeruleus subsp. azureus]